MNRLCSLCSALNRRSYRLLTKATYGTSTYDGEGKTKVQILNNEIDLGLMIDGYSQVGFRLNNGITVLGPMAIFPRSVLSWQVGSVDDINEESLSLFKIIEPKIDILILGVGNDPTDSRIYTRFMSILRKDKINIEILPTDHACTTFNFLNSEGRSVAGALIPPSKIRSSWDDVMQSKMRYQSLYERDD